jgi:hypothetical protein
MKENRLTEVKGDASTPLRIICTIKIPSSVLLDDQYIAQCFIILVGVVSSYAVLQGAAIDGVYTYTMWIRDAKNFITTTTVVTSPRITRTIEELGTWSKEIWITVFGIA